MLLKSIKTSITNNMNMRGERNNINYNLMNY